MNPTTQTAFYNRLQVLDVSLELIQSLRLPLERIQTHDRSLADQLRRAATSVPLNLGEGNRRTGKDRRHLWRVAAGCADEVRSCLQIALAWGYFTDEDTAGPLDFVDRILVMTWRLTH